MIRHWTLVVGLVVGAAAVMLPSCNLLIPGIYLAEGPPKNDALYTLPHKKTVVIVDDTTNHMSRVAMRSEMGDAVAEVLLEQDLVPEVVATRDAITYARKTDSSGRASSIQRIGEALGVEQVVYVKVDQFSLVGTGIDRSPEAIVLVRVIDVTSGSRLWPSAGSEAVKGTLIDIEPSLTSTSAGRREIEDKLARETGEAIAKLFYAHERRELGGRLGVKK
ncbi:MAG: hypothetical protein EXS03_07260 [Phycisphaerales bacterium]|nr:hypothetical protein [Phycisphaerales bacterium]